MTEKSSIEGFLTPKIWSFWSIPIPKFSVLFLRDLGSGESSADLEHLFVVILEILLCLAPSSGRIFPGFKGVFWCGWIEEPELVLSPSLGLKQEPGLVLSLGWVSNKNLG